VCDNKGKGARVVW